MSQDNPILPSEPLALEPDLLAAAVQAEELLGNEDKTTSGHSLSPRRASKVRRRLDNRHFGRSESYERHSDHEGREDARTSYEEHAKAPQYHRHGRSDMNSVAILTSTVMSAVPAPAPSRVLGIFGMSKFTNEDSLQEMFGKFGPVEKIQIIRDPN
ncbi:hypothetical protein GGI05_000401, partial [Coemansia sp. RSA 2603]